MAPLGNTSNPCPGVNTPGYAVTAKVVEEIKKQSSKWIKEKGAEYMNFAWQPGYGAFSVSSSKLEIVKNYIANQTDHHKKVSYMEEISALMQHYGILEFDPKYFWE